ncbi:hypothetical protein [Lentzea albida]|uniref:Uncharacterized protein n=1 Tax=Lentzea albida TaxID=65499 RepID=A0A1H9V891_9PSEU|nr:hypothetical protein [Lentzea albida]SES17769.1 hypothetical protein SAMN04488000_117108 [Lentzea albida]
MLTRPVLAALTVVTSLLVPSAAAAAVGANGVVAGYSGTKPVVWTCG